MKRWVVLGSVLVLVGAGFGLWALLGDDGPPPPSVDTVTSRAPTRRASPPLAPPPHVAPEDIVWPPVTEGQRRSVDEGRRSILAAAEAYRRGAQREGDGRMLRALALLGRSGTPPAALRGYHYETVTEPMARGDLVETEKRLRLWLENFPDELYARLLLAKVLLQNNNPPGAAVAADEVLEKRPDDAEAREVAAIARYRLGQWADAADEADQLGELEPDSLQAQRLLAESCSELGDKERGVRAVRRALELIGFPTEAAWNHPRGELVLRTAYRILHRFKEYGDLEHVAAFFRTRNADDSEAVMAEGVARFHNGDLEGAEPLLERALADESNAAEVRFTLGLLYAKRGEHRRAARTFAALLEEDPFFGRAYHQLGSMASRLGEREPARALFQRSRELAPSDRELRRERELRGVGQPGRAAVARCEAFLLQGRLDLAEAALREPSLAHDSIALLRLAELYLDELRLDEARAAIDRVATAVGASHPDVAGSRAKLLWTRGERAEATAALDRLLAESPRHDWQLVLARWYVESGEPAKALPVLLPLRETAGDREASLLLGRARLALGEPAEALALFQSISRGDLRWDEWQVGVWTARALLDSGGSAAEAWELLESVGVEFGTTVELETRVRVLTALAREDGARKDDLLGATETLEHARRLAPEVEALRGRILSSGWPSAAPLHVELARKLEASGRRPRAVFHVRVALLARPDDVSALELLAAWLARDEDAFLRLGVLRRLSALTPGDAEIAGRVRELERRWFLTPGAAE